MSKDASRFGHMIAGHMPSGLRWMEIETALTTLLTGVGAYFATLEVAMQTFVKNRQWVQSTEDYLAEYETALGLPDAVFGEAVTDADRQAEVERILMQDTTPTTLMLADALDALGSISLVVPASTDWPWIVWVDTDLVTTFRIGYDSISTPLRSVTADDAIKLEWIMRYIPAWVRAEFY